MQTKAELLTLLFNHKDTIKSFGVNDLGLFGSFVTGKNINKDSDVDFLIEFSPNKKTYDNFIGLTFFLEELLGRKIELVTRESLSPYIGPHILKQVEHVGI
ncbi:MAG: nucleotidyltransferase family protein [Ferruginibacter sp.]|nr:nucleotidyltransferase family protein [Ferruginibacter sp.]